MSDIEKKLRKLEKNKTVKPLKKFKGEGEVETRLEPYKRTKVVVRDIDDLIEDDFDSDLIQDEY